MTRRLQGSRILHRSYFILQHDIRNVIANGCTYNMAQLYNELSYMSRKGLLLHIRGGTIDKKWPLFFNYPEDSKSISAIDTRYKITHSFSNLSINLFWLIWCNWIYCLQFISQHRLRPWARCAMLWPFINLLFSLSDFPHYWMYNNW